MSDNNDHKPKAPPSLGAYRKTEVLTANRETILLMIYAEAIRSLKKALEHSDKKEQAERARYIVKAQEIVNELRSTLNFEIGGDIARNLDSLYAFVTQRLVSATVEGNSAAIEEALKVLTTLHSGWEEAIASLRKERAAA